jgi:hypothetical protein
MDVEAAFKQGGDRMALLGRKKKGGSGDARRQAVAPSAPAARYEAPQAGPSRLGSGLERRWEEAWRRARAADYK